MKKTIIIAILLMAAYSSAADFVIQDGSAYRILNDITSSYVSRGTLVFVNYIVFENQTMIDGLEAKEQEMNFSVSRANFESARLDIENIQTSDSIEKKSAALLISEAERNSTRDILNALETKKARLEGVINSSVLLSSGTYNISAAIFIILVIITITMKSRSMMLKNGINLKKNAVEKERKS
ncbi:MAG: hypothetical protein HYT73_04085 [Candidatus Aenigmarchaeota archaeon]|nr:hypothetical protein [Candidatus Aenigmarchaeota archaeon]